MNQTEKVERLQLLYMALQYSSQVVEFLTPGQRILINQERASLLHALNFQRSRIKKVPTRLNDKIEYYASRWGAYNWYPTRISDPLIPKTFLPHGNDK